MRNNIVFQSAVFLTALALGPAHGQGLGTFLRSTEESALAAARQAIPETGSKRPVTKEDENLAALLARSSNTFAFDLYARLTEQPPSSGNIFFSPYSIANCLGLAYVGARGETADQMARTLQLSLAPQHLPAAAAALRSTIDRQALNKTGYRLTTANALWGQKGLGFRPDYAQTVANGFGALVQEADFKTNPEPARLSINSWIKQQTQGKFPELFPPGSISSGTEVVLANAVYFKAAWARPFDKKNTDDAPFYVSDVRTVRVPMMKQTGSYRYLRARDFRAIELPYAGGELSMIVMVPEAKLGLAEFEKALNLANVTDWLGKMKKYDVEVYLPRFQMTYDCELRERLSRMGMVRAFSLDADFSGMTGMRNFHLSAIMHKAFVNVNEEGTEAAAVTAAFIDRSLPDLPIFRADRPFAFMVRDTRTGCILFMGRLVNPR
jgi:serpin B